MAIVNHEKKQPRSHSRASARWQHTTPPPLLEEKIIICFSSRSSVAQICWIGFRGHQVGLNSIEQMRRRGRKQPSRAGLKGSSRRAEMTKASGLLTVRAPTGGGKYGIYVLYLEIMISPASHGIPSPGKTRVEEPRHQGPGPRTLIES